MNPGPLEPMLAGPLIAALFGIGCLLILVVSLLTGATVLFPSTVVIRFRESPVFFSFACLFWLFCVAAAALVLFC